MRKQYLALLLISSLFIVYTEGFSKSSKKMIQINRLYKKYKKHFSKVPDIRVSTLFIFGENVILVDVRAVGEQRISMIPGAVTVTEFKKSPNKFKKKLLVFYCTIGYRSGVYAKKMRSRGYKVFNLKGGILSWTYQGKPLVAKGKPVFRLHVYGKLWDLAAPGYQTVW